MHTNKHATWPVHMHDPPPPQCYTAYDPTPHATWPVHMHSEHPSPYLCTCILNPLYPAHAYACMSPPDSTWPVHT